MTFTKGVGPLGKKKKKTIVSIIWNLSLPEENKSDFFLPNCLLDFLHHVLKWSFREDLICVWKLTYKILQFYFWAFYSGLLVHFYIVSHCLMSSALPYSLSKSSWKKKKSLKLQCFHPFHPVKNSKITLLSSKKKVKILFMYKSFCKKLTSLSTLLFLTGTQSFSLINQLTFELWASLLKKKPISIKSISWHFILSLSMKAFPFHIC